jgi:bifunctional non-homologous end joining protein LigD
VFDLDPGEGADILTCARVAVVLKRAFDEFGLQAFPKVSGSKGLQVHIPLNTTVTYAETQPFAKALAELLARRHPDLIVAEMTKTLRRGKVFIDWSQNSDFKTTVGVYSLRAKAAQPFVSLPVQWSELDAAVRRDDANALVFGMDEAVERLDRKGDLFKTMLKLTQKLP